MSSNGLANGYGIDGTKTNAGSSSNPYAIRDGSDLKAISSSNWGSSVYYQVTNDIDMSGISDWNPIGYTSAYNDTFTGIFNGSNYTISNLRYDGYYMERLSGLFLKITNATISNCKFNYRRHEAGGLLTSTQ